MPKPFTMMLKKTEEIHISQKRISNTEPTSVISTKHEATASLLVSIPLNPSRIQLSLILKARSFKLRFDLLMETVRLENLVSILNPKMVITLPPQIWQIFLQADTWHLQEAHFN